MKTIMLENIYIMKVLIDENYNNVKHIHNELSHCISSISPCKPNPLAAKHSRIEIAPEKALAAISTYMGL